MSLFPSFISESSSEEEEEHRLLSTRPPVTQHEAHVIHKIARGLKQSETFYLAGTLDLAALGVSQPALLYTINDPDGSIQGAKAIPLRNPLSHQLEELHADCHPSPFGHGKETVYDESYRLARELQSNRFGLNFDPIATSTGVLATVSAFTTPTAGGDAEDTRMNITGVEAKLYKLNSYTTGGHFKKHQDTPKAKNHIGTLIFGIPTPFKGGKLILTHGSVSEADGSLRGPQEVKIDWSELGKSKSSSGSSIILPWVFFYSDVEHEIRRVKSGHRLTLSYDIFATETVRYRVPYDPNKVKPRTDLLFTEFQEALQDGEFLNKGGKLAFALSYQYPAKDMENLKDAAFNTILKGNDYLLLHTLTSLSLTSEVRAVYKFEYLSETGWHIDTQSEFLAKSGKTGYPVDRFSSLGSDGGSTRSSDSDADDRPIDWDTALATALTFKGMNERHVEEEEWKRAEYLAESTGASIDWDLIWVRRPTKNVWSVASVYSRYGNCPCTEYSYVAGALVVDVPAFGEGIRKVGER